MFADLVFTTGTYTSRLMLKAEKRVKIICKRTFHMTSYVYLAKHYTRKTTLKNTLQKMTTLSSE